jgi:nondiscriminating aspartyl-tRNA synthetase
MERVRTAEVHAHAGQRVRVEGWLHSWRRMGALNFLIVRDGSGLVQAVAESDGEVQVLIDAGAALESVIAVEGRAVTSAQAPGGVELHELQVEIVSAVQEAPPLALHKRELKTSLPVLLDHAVVANRHPTRRALLRLGAGVMAGFRATLEQAGFTEIQTPKLVASATEGGAGVFAVDYFGRTAYLAQSPQFYKQIMVGVFERVFEVGPVFRAEPHDTTRHINEYVSLDVELGFIRDHRDVMAMLRQVLAGILGRLRGHHAAELELLGVEMPALPETVPQLHFTEAQELLLRLHGVDRRGEPDLAPQDERQLGQWARATHGSDFLFVTGYPMRKRPFYTHPDRTRPEHSNSFDLLFRGTELVTGGQRLHRYDDYLAALALAGLPREPFEGYLEAFRHGMPPHGGFAIGLERLLMQLCRLPNIRLATTFPRDLERLTP